MLTDPLWYSQGLSNILYGHFWMAALNVALPLPRFKSNVQPIDGVIHQIWHAECPTTFYP